MVKAGADITMRAHPGVLESEQISFRRGRRYRHMKSDEWDKVNCGPCLREPVYGANRCIPGFNITRELLRRNK